MKLNIIRLIAISLLAAALFSGCAKEAEEEPPDPVAPSTASPPQTRPPAPTPTPTPEPTPLPFVNKLNGERYEEDPGNTRPYAIMINNIIYAIPHCGVSKADIIYEILAEGGVTRMICIYSDMSEAKSIGSIRSIRPYFIEVALAFDAITVHAGGSPQAYTDIKNLGVDNICGVNGPGAGFLYSDPNRRYNGTEHSWFTTPKRISEQIEKLKYREEHTEDDFDYGLRFFESEVPALSGLSAVSVNVDFGGEKMTYLKYDADKEIYTAIQHNVDYIDGDTGKKVEFDNILIIYTPTRVIDNYGRRNIDLIGSGPGHYAREGKYIDINWRHDSTGAQFFYALENGDELELKPGKTYIAVVPTGSDIIFG
ncbi:MAG: DUF3048 domain-containing protein [Oscillospiraceae bacterium]|nr:DUF3048 domain-containing protein [Oscillospiraceae bacterium]